MPANYRPYPKMGPSWTVTVHFFIHWVSVLYYHCGAFPGTGKCWISLGWKSFLSERKVMRKTIIALGRGLAVVWLCPLAPVETGWALPADIPSINLTQAAARETDKLQSWGQFHSLLTLRLWKCSTSSFLKLLLINTASDRDTVPEKPAWKYFSEQSVLPDWDNSGCGNKGGQEFSLDIWNL